MKKSFTLTKEKLDNLFEWLSSDGDEAGAKYEEVRESLIRFFRVRDCADPISLTDETLNRVADKLPEEEAERKKIPLKYIYGFAVNIYREYERISSKTEIQLDQSLPLAPLVSQDFAGNQSKDVGCLEECLARLSPDESEMMLDYYGQEKSVRPDFRMKLAEEHHITIQTLHTRVHRIKAKLKECVEKCLNEKIL